jgi:hypothetical protein
MNLREAAQQATPREQLMKELMDSRVPKTEREHAAVREIERLRAALADTQDWSELEALRESLREHMAEIHRLRAALAEDAMQRLTDVQQEMVGPSIKETRHHRANRMLKEAMDSDRENIIRNMPDFDFSTESQQRKPLTEEEITRLWVEAEPGPEAFARAIERAHGIGGEK